MFHKKKGKTGALNPAAFVKATKANARLATNISKHLPTPKKGAKSANPLLGSSNNNPYIKPVVLWNVRAFLVHFVRTLDRLLL